MSSEDAPEPVHGAGSAHARARDADRSGRVRTAAAAADDHGNGRLGTADRAPLRSRRRAPFNLATRSLRHRLRATLRLVAAGDVERERIGQDLHDGAQQTLTSVRIRLAIAADDFCARGDENAGAALAAFGDEVEQAIEELRELAHGAYPVLLASRGLRPALADAARQAPQPVTVLARGVSRSPHDVEIAVYFCCLAAIQNAAKHAGPARVSVRVWETPTNLHFSVLDTGCGFDLSRTSPGAGITNMHDRLASVGGTLSIDSKPAHGTSIEGTIPGV